MNNLKIKKKSFHDIKPEQRDEILFDNVSDIKTLLEKLTQRQREQPAKCERKLSDVFLKKQHFKIFLSGITITLMILGSIVAIAMRSAPSP